MARNNPLTRSKHKAGLEAYRGNRLLEAKEIYQKIVSKDRIDDVAWAMLGIILAALNKLDDAEISLKKAISINPDNFDANYNLGLVFHHKGVMEEALGSYRKTLAIKPGHINTIHNMGVTYTLLDQLNQARQCYEKILHSEPENAAAHDNLANVLSSMGETELAISHYRMALESKALSSTYSNLLLCLHYQSTYDPMYTFKEHQNWAAKFTKGFSNIVPRQNGSNRKIRVGYVTPDLRGHSVSYFFEPLLTYHDNISFEIFCYLDLKIVDATTTKLMNFAGTIRNTTQLTDNQLDALIRADRIDILVDLAGHTAGNRLLVFARKPAPVQVTYLGYPDTTGLDTIDYRLTDENADPPGMTEHLHTEKLTRLEGGFLCFVPPSESPAVTPLPLHDNGYVTFGSFNVFTKLNLRQLSLWASILKRVPSAKLLIKNRQLTDEFIKNHLNTFFKEQGIEGDRLELLGRTSKQDHMASYGKVDIALDSYPYCGTTTTCDSLWMGVPVISLAGPTHVTRVGVSLLKKVGLSEFIANTEEEYIELAAKLANSPGHLEYLRCNLRGLVENSGLTDGETFTRILEKTYRQMWQDSCKTGEVR